MFHPHQYNQQRQLKALTNKQNQQKLTNQYKLNLKKQAAMKGEKILCDTIKDLDCQCQYGPL